jgi:hypothetical protein
MRAGAVIIPFPRRPRRRFVLSAFCEESLRAERAADRLMISYLALAAAVIGLLQLLAMS